MKHSYLEINTSAEILYFLQSWHTRGEDGEINILRAEAEGQSRLTGSQGWYHTLNLVNVTLNVAISEAHTYAEILYLCSAGT